MVKRIVVALGGNAILSKDPSAKAQKEALEVTAEQLMPLIKDNDRQMVVTHGNGPQVGNLLLQQLGSDSEKNPAMPLDTVGAMTQGEIGFWTVQAFTRAMANNGLERYPVISAVTQTLIDENDPAFKNASKPIGPFYTEEQLPEIKKQFPDWELMEDAGRGYRRVVPSPKPLEIIEAKAFGPILGIFLICVRDSIFPFSSRYDTILDALALFNPATFLSKETLAVLIFTPTRLTAFSTTKSKRSFNLAVGKSC